MGMTDPSENTLSHPYVTSGGHPVLNEEAHQSRLENRLSDWGQHRDSTRQVGKGTKFLRAQPVRAFQVDFLPRGDTPRPPVPVPSVPPGRQAARRLHAVETKSASEKWALCYPLIRDGKPQQGRDLPKFTEKVSCPARYL